MLNFFDSVSCETIIAENEAYEQVLAMVRLHYNGAEAMDIAGLTEEELQSSLPGLKPENIFVTKLDPEKIITDGEDKTATNMNDQTLWTRLWLIVENEDNVVAVVFDLETFSMECYTKVK